MGTATTTTASRHGSLLEGQGDGAAAVQAVHPATFWCQSRGEQAQIMVLGGALDAAPWPARVVGGAFDAAPWSARVVGDTRRSGLLAWWAAPGTLACSRGGLPPRLRGGELMRLPTTSLCCFPAHVGVRRRPRGGADSRWTAVGRPRGGERLSWETIVGDSFFLATIIVEISRRY
jgi:hypothetical protein